MSPDRTFVSIVMPSFNQAQFIQQAIESVLSQCWADLELIVQDGGSNDGTLALLRDISKIDPRLRWYSDPDNGPADAINKALHRTRGTVIGWLNSDDCYLPGAIKRAVTSLAQHPGWIMVYGDGEHIDAEGRVLERYPTSTPSMEAFQRGCYICQPTVFFKRSMNVLLGDLDVQLGTAFDFDYWLRAFNAFPGRIGYLPVMQACSRLHEDCITHNQRRRVTLEGMQVLAKHQGSAPANWIISYRNEQLRAGITQEALVPDIDSMMREIKRYMYPDEWRALYDALKR